MVSVHFKCVVHSFWRVNKKEKRKQQCKLLPVVINSSGVQPSKETQLKP
jgi:hypothetical protein